ncbi:MAG: hypothetical protein CEE40_06520 [Chloroflexi bacterium B3_Chlor]|nr:MAG: hypothetical protein CEE40_06520 [Chloroflexi bacterium B3_Chlor]
MLTEMRGLDELPDRLAAEAKAAVYAGFSVLAGSVGIDLWRFHPLAQEHSVGHSGTRDSCARCVGSDVHSPLPSLNPHRLR